MLLQLLLVLGLSILIAYYWYTTFYSKLEERYDTTCMVSAMTHSTGILDRNPSTVVMYSWLVVGRALVRPFKRSMHVESRIFDFVTAVVIGNWVMSWDKRRGVRLANTGCWLWLPGRRSTNTVVPGTVLHLREVQQIWHTTSRSEESSPPIIEYHSYYRSTLW